MRTKLLLTFILVFIPFFMGSWNRADAIKIDTSAENLSRRYSGSINRDSLVKRHLNDLRVRAGSVTHATTTLKAARTSPASNSKLLDNNEKTDINSGQPVITDSSPQVLYGLICVGAVLGVVVGIFTVANKRKRRKIANSIVATSSAAWEQQSIEKLKEEEEIQPLGSYTVIDMYVPTLSDELDLQLGDKITILVIYDDGWVQGINETQGGVKGVFPQHCVNMNNPFSRNDKRSSSMGGYTVVNLN